MHPLRRLILLTVFSIAGLSTPALAYNITGRVIDSSSEPLPDATVRLLSSRDSSFVKGTIADIDGNFTLTGLKKGSYIVESQYVGYTTAYKNASIADRNVALGDIALQESSHMLAETVVTGVKTPIKVMQDTVEYNADSYKTQPNAVVEDLLKRLPGVEVDSDGKITANGKEVTKILIDGKEFFSDDPKVASKNLPVNMVEKLQVVDRKSDLSRLTGVDDGEDETVINLTVKKGMQNGWFGTAETGYGTDDRYKVTFNVNRFWDGNQITFIGNANNTNELGFTDGNGARFRRFGGDQGINNSQSFGVNFNVGKEEIIRVGGNVMYSHTDRNSIQRNMRQYLLDENSYEERSLTDNTDKGHNVRADFRVEWKPNEYNTLDFRPRFSYNQNESYSDALSEAIGKNLTLNRSLADGTSYEASGRLIYNHNFKAKPGRSFSIHANYRFSDVNEMGDDYSYNIFHQLNDSLDVYDQLTDNHTWNNQLNARVSWTEPIGDSKNGNFLTFSYGINSRWNNADKLVYDRAVNPTEEYWDYLLGDREYAIPVYEVDESNAVLNDTLSNRFRNTTFQHNIRAGYKKVSSTYTLDAGISVVPIRSHSVNLINDAKSIPARVTWNVAPFVRLKYKFNETSSLNFDYFGRSSQPSMSQLQPVADYSNPLNVVIGNPELVPTFNHSIRLRSQYFNPDKQMSIMAMAFATVSQNSIISKTLYDLTTGGRTTTYENVNGVWNARLMSMFSMPLRNKAWSINNHLFFSASRNVGYSNGERNVGMTTGFAEMFSIAFRPDNLELELRPNYFFQNVHNSLPSLDNQVSHRFGGTFNATYYTPWNIILASDLNYSATRGYSNGYDSDSWMWNASIAYQFLPGKNATIMLKAYDLLQQKKDINRNVTATYIDDTEYNALTRYFMLSFTYKFNTFGAGNQPADRNARRHFGPPPGHGRH